VEPRAAVVETVRADHEATLAWVRAEVARTADPIHSFFAQVADDPSVQLVSQAQLAHARRLLAGTPHDRLPLLSAAAPFKSSDPAGPPEQALLNLGSPSYSFDTIDGLRYRIDVTQPARYDRSGRLVAHEARGIAHRAAVPQVSLLRDWGNGFATYEAAP
jgi:2',3'-cyclic-nucleotide 2'-phosphodiesterase/3'-nucleotidase